MSVANSEPSAPTSLASRQITASTTEDENWSRDKETITAQFKTDLFLGRFTSRTVRGSQVYPPPQPPSASSSSRIMDAHLRSTEYLEKIRNLPYHVEVLTHDIPNLNNACKVKLFSLNKTGCSDPIMIESLTDLEKNLQSIVDARSDDVKVLIARDPAPEAVRTLGGYLDIPVEFFISHAATGAVITINRDQEDLIWCQVSISYRQRSFAYRINPTLLAP